MGGKQRHGDSSAEKGQLEEPKSPDPGWAFAFSELTSVE